MGIGEIIRKYRKQAGLTQEEVARRLGVTTPAVNKWENGSNLPDVLLLAPIARLLGITTDELLGFREQLTEVEVGQFIQELDACLRKQPYETAFQLAKKKIETYPACGSLVWQAAAVLDGWRLLHPVENAEKYDAAIEVYYRRLLENQDEALRNAGAEALFQRAMRSNEYEQAQAYLDHLPRENPEHKRKQAVLHEKTGRREEAYKAYEELLFTGYQHIQSVLNGLHMLYLEEKDTDSARMIAEKSSALAAVFDMGRYNETSPLLELAVAQKDREATADIMRALIDGADTLTAFRTSRLYGHMEFKTPDEHFSARVRDDLVRGFCDEEEFSFMRGHPYWEALREQADSGTKEA